MVEPLVKHAYETEKKAASSYTDGLGRIRGTGGLGTLRLRR